MKVRNIMSKDVLSLSPEDSIEKAAQLMKQHGIGSLPICEGEKVIGIVTDRDIVLRATAKGQESAESEGYHEPEPGCRRS